MIDIQELLRDMRRDVVWTHVATMPIPLYERMKGAIKQLATHELTSKELDDQEGGDLDDKLLPCPFCGKLADYITMTFVNNNEQHWVICKCNIRTAQYETKDNAIKAWNTRAKHDPCKGETAGDFLKRLGTDGMEWAKEMHKRFPAAPLDDLLGWCCNMIETGRDSRQQQLNTTQQALDEANAELAAYEISYKEWVAKHGEMYAKNQSVQQALTIRSKQIGVACLKHDLTHSLECGHCYKEMKQALDSAVEALKPFARVGGLPSIIRHNDAGLWSYNIDDEIIIKITAKDCIAAKAALASISKE